jgi:DNA-binding NtrC family response regulator
MIRRALIVDDEPAMQRALARELRKACDVVVASNGQQAMELIGQVQGLCAVVSDLDLGPGADGAEVLRYAQRTVPACARILVTGSVTQEAAGELITAWTAHFVFLKPWDVGKILHAVEEAIAFEEGGPDAKSRVQLRSERIVKAGSMSRSG